MPHPNLFRSQCSSAQHSAARAVHHSIAQLSTTQHSTTHRSTAQLSVAQHQYLVYDPGHTCHLYMHTRSLYIERGGRDREERERRRDILYIYIYIYVYTYVYTSTCVYIYVSMHICILCSLYVSLYM